jgi:hypothetical protein
MTRLVKLSLLTAMLGAGACYHATIDTGLAPSNQVVEKSFAAAWIEGLVPPSTVETASKCPHGAAKVETQLSFVNMLVGAITLGIYTPMSIKVTCAEAGRASLPASAPAIDAGSGATLEQLKNVIAHAADLSLRTGAPVYIEY